jgi:hypothetical protein
LSSQYPQNLDSIINPNATDNLSNPSHSQQHIIANTAIQALEAKVGIDGSTDVNSLDYKVSQLEAAGGTTTVEVLGLQGNNDLQVYGIENPTTIDTLDTSVWRSAQYKIQATKGSDVYSADLSVLFSNGSTNISEHNIISTSDNFNNPANFDFVYNGSIINLVVTPVSGSVSVRFSRTALKNKIKQGAIHTNGNNRQKF